MKGVVCKRMNKLKRLFYQIISEIESIRKMCEPILPIFDIIPPTQRLRHDIEHNIINLMNKYFALN